MNRLRGSLDRDGPRSAHFSTKRVPAALGILLGLSVGGVAAEVDTPAVEKGEVIPVPVLESGSAPGPVAGPSGVVGPAAVEIVVFVEDFEGASAPGWTSTGSWRIGTVVATPGSGGFGASPGAAGTNLSGNHGNGANDVLTSPVIALPSGAFAFRIEYDEWFVIESGFDLGTLEVAIDGGSWTSLGTVSGSSGWRSTSRPLNAPAGSNVQMRFRFTSDGSVTNPGWFVDNVRVIAAEIEPIELTLVGLNAQAFPLVVSQVRVNDLGGNCPDPLTVDNFQVFEDGVLQTGQFQVTPPGGPSLADVVFIFDNSGSMGGEQAAVEANIIDFVDGLGTAGVDAALGLTRYGQGANSGNPILEDGGNLTTDADYFKNSVLPRNIASGGREPGYFAIVQSASGFGFRPGSQRVFIEITDETPNQDATTLSQADTALTTADATLFAVTHPNLYSLFEPLVDDPSSQLIDILAPFDDVLSFIVNQVSSVYTVSYRTFNDVTNGIPRNVEIVATCGPDRGTVTELYTPSAAPVIERGLATVALSQSGQVDNQPLTVSVEVEDSQAPFVQSVTLFYRNSSATSYASVAMTRDSGDDQMGVYSGQIPAAAVQGPGIDYYIVATDGTLTTSDPSTTPAQAPYQIAVLPNQPPFLQHIPVSLAPTGVDIPIETIADDFTNSLDEVAIYYRTAGSLLYVKSVLTPGAGSAYAGVIPGAAMTANGVEYYLRAVDNFGVGNTVGTADVPLFISAPAPTTPDILVQPVSVRSMQDPGVQYTKVLVISNEGDADLSVSGVFESSDNCNSPTDLSWLSLGGTVGVLPPMGSGMVPVTLDSTGRAQGLVTASVCIASNDPDEPTIQIPVVLETLPVNICVAADFNADGVVDNNDLIQVFVNFGQTVVPGTAGDATGNGHVDADDYALLVDCFGEVLP